jgi:hypothetical protein
MKQHTSRGYESNKTQRTQTQPKQRNTHQLINETDANKQQSNTLTQPNNTTLTDKVKYAQPTTQQKGILR